MRGLALLTLVSFTACSDRDPYPINPGGGGGGGSGSNGLETRVCLIADLGALTSCATTGADGILVLLDARDASTNPDGSFTIDKPTSKAPRWEISRDDLVTSELLYTTRSTNLPIIRTTDYDALLAANSVVMQPGRGSLVVRITKANEPVRGAKAVLMQAEGVSLYDTTTTTTTWGTTATGDKGIVWMPNNAPGNRTVMITSTSAPTMATFEVFDNAITFATIDLP